MIFQASRFSASGRKVPLEPRRSEACRSCQPMHVLSFGEGRKKPTRLRSECDPVQDEPPGVLVYIGAPRRREPSRLECPSPECKS
ncbi:hypothetical protein LSM04_001447 [Trypanosoma melophagium]|uniref:uncharacterized protein n=1 Tax=Trypanosoma melophagium TaxID=715481 RepID=UPI00351A6F85|nr:hypothetical protein LSM04_001447 [Trypanosoma melophagium]